MAYKKDPAPTTETYVREIINRKACGRHAKSPGKPCWWLHTDSGSLLAGICNFRANKAGFNAKISPQSLSRSNGAPRFSKKK